MITNTSAVWQQTAHFTYQVSPLRWSIRAIIQLVFFKSHLTNKQKTFKKKKIFSGKNCQENKPLTETRERQDQCKKFTTL